MLTNISEQFDEAMLTDVVQWIKNNPQDTTLIESVKNDVLRFKTLNDEEKEQLLANLLALPELPDILKNFIPYRLEKLSEELLQKVTSYLNPQDLWGLAKSSKQNYSVFQSKKVLDKFLQCIAYGQQDKVEQLFTNVYQGNEKKIQKALQFEGKFTDYSGRTFHCTAYEYAYWAKDTHMCRMLERHMDESTKREMFKRVNAIEKNGLSYQQNGKKHRSAHFDFTPLKQALRAYVNGYDDWIHTGNWNALNAAFKQIGLAQRNVPAHVAQEYCRSDYSFERPIRSFKEFHLPRMLDVVNMTTPTDDPWFPLKTADSGLGFNFTVIRDENKNARGVSSSGSAMMAVSLEAVILLDKVRTEDLKLSRENVKPALTSPDIPDTKLIEAVKNDVLLFKTLSDEQKEEFLASLLALPEPPDILKNLIPYRLEKLPEELIHKIISYLKPKDYTALGNASKQNYNFFKRKQVVYDKFLQCIARGQQDKAEQLFTKVYSGKKEKIQEALQYEETFTDYSGRTFRCTAYEYAYWAKDTHMCRMLERHMDEGTKREIFKRVNEIEKNGLSYQQNGKKYRSAHFDFTPLKQALRAYVNGYDGWAWGTPRNMDAINKAFLEIGRAQRDVPAHVAQEYCRPDVSFGKPLRSFNESKFPRVLDVVNMTAPTDDPWFPLKAADSGLGFNVVVIRDEHKSAKGVSSTGSGMMALSLAAVVRLDKVRTEDLKVSRENLTLPTISLGRFPRV